MVVFPVRVLLLVFWNHVVFGADDPNKIEYDYIIVGAGAAGCAVASRLSENSKHQVLLLEAGGEPEKILDIPYIVTNSPNYFWLYSSESETNAFLANEGEKTFVPQGKGLGGSTLVNGMKCTRGNKHDYNHWRDLGNEGWGYDDVLPYYKKMETFLGKVTASSMNYHGYTGPFTISPPPYKPALTDTLIAAGKEMGYDEVDYDAERQKGVSLAHYNLRNGMRFTTYEAYLENQRNRTNLHIVTKALVYKVLFKEKRATGVLYEHEGKELTARAKKEVILSAGAISSPKLLQLSGIGPKDILDRFKIPVVHELPGVGKNLQNHVSVANLEILLKKEVGFRYDKDITPRNLYDLQILGKGPLTVPWRTIGITFFDSDNANKSIDWPDLEFSINQITGTPNFKKEYMQDNEYKHCENRLAVRPYLLRPKSVGEIKIKSGDPRDAPSIKFNYLSEQDDVKAIVSGIKLFVQMISTKAFQKYGATTTSFFNLKPCEQHKIMSDEYFECYARLFTGSAYHMSGTCKMGPQNDVNAVVDSQLRVYGVQGLRVVDVSICPTVITGHTMVPAVMIGERAADMIKRTKKNGK